MAFRGVVRSDSTLIAGLLRGCWTLVYSFRSAVVAVDRQAGRVVATSDSLEFPTFSTGASNFGCISGEMVNFTMFYEFGVRPLLLSLRPSKETWGRPGLGSEYRCSAMSPLSLVSFVGSRVPESGSAGLLPSSFSSVRSDIYN